MEENDSTVPILIITGPVGVGKTSVSDAISEILNSKRISHALIDMDQLRQAYPRPESDPFYSKLGLKNLSVIWENFRQEGVKSLVIPNVIEEKADLERIQNAIPGSKIIVVRLTADLPTINDRLTRRDKGDSLRWHLNRAKELAEIFEREKLEDFLIDTQGKSINQIAVEILVKVGWINN